MQSFVSFSSLVDPGSCLRIAQQYLSCSLVRERGIVLSLSSGVQRDAVVGHA